MTPTLRTPIRMRDGRSVSRRRLTDGTYQVDLRFAAFQRMEARKRAEDRRGCYIDTLLVTALRAAERGDAHTAESVILCIMRHGVVVGERSKHFATVAPSRLARRGVTV